ncbi:MAG: RNA polymerase sigma factor [Alphaproteobacteria bacterium]|nr:RNA polymerase sigma factor [Alphaproteobacteria bacterium]
MTLTPMEVGGVRSEPDPDLLAAAIAGDRSALGGVAELYYPRMRRWALLETGGDAAHADDAVQEALVRWIRFAHTYRADQPFGPWMRTLVRNAARDVRRPRGILGFLPWARPSQRPDRATDLSRSARRVLDHLGRLTPRQRELVDLCDLQGLPAAEAARELGIDAGTARVHLHEARKRLKAELDGVAELLEEEA